MQWMVPERRLDEHQRSILRRCGEANKSNNWIKGFAGSGKTILLVHLVQKFLTEKTDAKVCVVVFTHALKELISTGFEDKFAGRVPVMTYHSFLKNGHRFDLVVVDEVQDIPKAKLEEIKSLAEKIVIAGDTEQSIYENGSSEGDIGVVLAPRVHKLVVLYRLTQKLREIVRTILPGSQIETAKSSRMQDVQVTLAKASSEEQELAWIWDNCHRYASQGDPTVVLLPGHKAVQNFIRGVCQISEKACPDFPDNQWGKYDYQPANRFLKDVEIQLQYLGNSYGNLSDSDNQPLTYVMTYHSAKGLDFETVFLPGLNSDLKFSQKNDDIDRRLFFVGATRSRKNLFLSYFSTNPHEYVTAMPQNLLHIVDCEILKGEDLDDDNFLF